MKKNDQPILHDKGVSYVLPFILITFCFALWGFANDITNPMVKAFSKIFRMSVTDGALVQVAFYGGYFAMAFPAAIFIRKYTYKAGILMGLALYAIGAFLFLPAKWSGEYYPFLIAYFILTCGLSFLETSANPYILSMGSEATATRRLNLAQSFNPMGSLLGMFVAMSFIQAQLNPMDTADRAQLNDAEFAAVRDSDLSILVAPYLFIGIVVLVIFFIIFFSRMPKNQDQSHDVHFMVSIRRIFSIPRYREGVIAQFFYVGAQIMCWTFIIQYGTRLFDMFLLQPFYLHLHAQIPQSGTLALDFGRSGHDTHLRSHSFAKHIRPLLPGRCLDMHVAHVPHHLRHCIGRTWRRCKIRCGRTYHVDSRRFAVAHGASSYHRYENCSQLSGRKHFICPTAYLFHRCRRIRIPFDEIFKGLRKPQGHHTKMRATIFVALIFVRKDSITKSRLSPREPYTWAAPR